MKKMDVNSFYSYTLNERLKLVRRQGEFLSRIRYFGYTIHLYVYEQTFIEVYYNIYSRALADIEILDEKDLRIHLYAAQVDLTDLNITK